MNLEGNLSWVFPLGVGLVLGSGLAWLWSRSRTAVLRERLDVAERTQGETAELRGENERLKIEAAELKKEREADAAKVSWVDRARAELERTFTALAAQALKENAGQVMQDASDKLVQPLGKTLENLAGQVRDLESKRAGAYGELLVQIRDLQQANVQLTHTTTTLSQALQSSTVRGRWGEMQLRRVVELAGLQRHVDFSEQAQREDGRPDLIVHLPHGGSLPIDAKATLTAYLESLNAPDEDTRKARLEEHADALRQRIKELGEKQYWKQFKPAPEFVVMFVPIESSLGAAFECRPDLLEVAVAQRVLLATPVILLALLKAVAFGWQQQQVAENIQIIERECRQLYERLIPFVEHLRDMGVRLEGAVKSYNAGVGSLQSRVFPVAERLKELGAGSEPLPALKPVEQPVKKVDSVGPASADQETHLDA